MMHRLWIFCLVLHLRYGSLENTQIGFFFKKRFFVFVFCKQESILFLPDIAVIEEPLISEDLLKSKVILPFYGFVKDYHPKVFIYAYFL